MEGEDQTQEGNGEQEQDVHIELRNYIVMFNTLRHFIWKVSSLILKYTIY